MAMGVHMQGMAAEWARTKLATGHFEKTGRLQRVNTREQDPKDLVLGCTKLVTAVGFQRNTLPSITVDGKPLKDVTYDAHSGAIIPGSLYGYGIAFPEEIKDPEYGHKEPNVGLLKFMKYIRRALPAQSLCSL